MACYWWACFQQQPHQWVKSKFPFNYFFPLSEILLFFPHSFNSVSHIWSNNTWTHAAFLFYMHTPSSGIKKCMRFPSGWCHMWSVLASDVYRHPFGHKFGRWPVWMCQVAFALLPWWYTPVLRLSPSPLVAFYTAAWPGRRLLDKGDWDWNKGYFFFLCFVLCGFQVFNKPPVENYSITLRVAYP